MRIWLLSVWLIALGCVGGAGGGRVGDAAVGADGGTGDTGAGGVGTGGTGAGGVTGGAGGTITDGGGDAVISPGADGGAADMSVGADAAVGDAPGAADGSPGADAPRPGDAAGTPDVAGGMDGSPGADTSGGADGGTGADLRVDAPDAATDGAVSPADARDAASDARDGPAGTIDAGPLVFGPWPGANMVAVVDGDDAFGTDLSGLAYQPAVGAASAVLWAVNNNSGKLFRLTWNGSIFTPVTTDGWRTGKTLRYPGGDGSPDTEGVTKAEWESTAVYVVAERDNDDNGVSRMSVLRYDATGTATTLTATHEWNLTADLPESDANKGLEGITWIPDATLVAKGFFDESAGKVYAPTDHPNHGTGLFFVALETDGRIYAYALNHTAGTFRRVASIASGQEAAMDLSFDRDVGTLWAICDETCDNRVTLLDVDPDPASSTRGRFRVRRGFSRPGTLPNEGNEGIAIAPESECAAGGGKKSFFWADDSNTDDHAIRRDLIPCGILY